MSFCRREKSIRPLLARVYCRVTPINDKLAANPMTNTMIMAPRVKVIRGFIVALGTPRTDSAIRMISNKSPNTTRRQALTATLYLVKFRMAPSSASSFIGIITSIKFQVGSTGPELTVSKLAVAQSVLTGNVPQNSHAPGPTRSSQVGDRARISSRYAMVSGAFPYRWRSTSVSSRETISSDGSDLRSPASACLP